MKRILFGCVLSAAAGLIVVLVSVLRRIPRRRKSDTTSVPDYRRYRLSGREYLLWGALFTALGAGSGFLLFQSVAAGLFIGLLLLVPFYRRLAKRFCKRRIARLEYQFCLYLQLMAASLAGGTPFEKVFRDVLSGVPAGTVSGEDLIATEFLYIDNLISFHYGPAEAFSRFAERSGSADIQCMAAALSAVVSSGGNLVQLVRNAAGALRSKLDTEKEITRIISLPQMNHRILTCMPFAFLAVLRWLSPGYAEYLYTGTGLIAMLAVSFLIGGAWLLGEKLGTVKF